jgi:hypothetical protein
MHGVVNAIREGRIINIVIISVALVLTLLLGSRVIMLFRRIQQERSKVCRAGQPEGPRRISRVLNCLAASSGLAIGAHVYMPRCPEDEISPGAFLMRVTCPVLASMTELSNQSHCADCCDDQPDPVQL